MKGGLAPKAGRCLPRGGEKIQPNRDNQKFGQQPKINRGSIAVTK